MKKILEYINKAWLRFCVKRRENATKNIIKKSNDLFDVSVYNEELWLVCDNCLICPMRMFENKDTSKVIEEIRKHYIMESLKEEYSCRL